jgi:hypothetical protein
LDARKPAARATDQMRLSTKQVLADRARITRT